MQASGKILVERFGFKDPEGIITPNIIMYRTYPKTGFFPKVLDKYNWVWLG